MTAQISLKIEAPFECSEEQFREWLEYSLGLSSSIKVDNPLVEEQIQSNDYTIEITK